MISNKTRESRRGKFVKLTKNLQRLYKERKCNECSVLVTRMDFAKILGKFTKVKIQYESSSPKSQKTKLTSPNTRLKSNENGMVFLPRRAYNQHPVKELLTTNKSKPKETPRANNVLKENSKFKVTSGPSPQNNVLKENNRLKKTPSLLKKRNTNYNNNKFETSSSLKHYGIVFVNPNKINDIDLQSKLSLLELLPYVNKDILPSGQWCIDYFPKDDEPKDDKVYDRIAAELEDLMYSERKPSEKSKADNKNDEFPSIFDILNDNPGTESVSNEKNQRTTSDFKSNLESNDVEAILLGKANAVNEESQPVPMEVDNSNVTKLVDVSITVQDNEIKPESTAELDFIDNPNSPSILDETLKKGIEEHLSCDQTQTDEASLPKLDETLAADTKMMDVDTKDMNPVTKENCDDSVLATRTITHLIFKKSRNGNCYKSVTCPKNLKYSIELQGKSVEFVGAPKFISSLEDLQVLLQIVDESDLDSLYVQH